MELNAGVSYLGPDYMAKFSPVRGGGGGGGGGGVQFSAG